MNILVIDNDPVALEQFSTRLREQSPGDQVISFTDPLLAVKHGYNYPVDVVYGKTIMRGLNLDDVERLLRNIHPNVQVKSIEDVSM